MIAVAALHRSKTYLNHEKSSDPSQSTSETESPALHVHCLSSPVRQYWSTVAIHFLPAIFAGNKGDIGHYSHTVRYWLVSKGDFARIAWKVEIDVPGPASIATTESKCAPENPVLQDEMPRN